MAGVTDIKTLIADIDAETNAVAKRVDAQTQAIQDLKAQITAGTPVSQADLDAIASELTPISDRLKSLGLDPNVPIPAPVPDTSTPTKTS